ncbi:hypothetical protein E1091_08055 [Micromonospora fluostatini]|uniref:Uncharacterized protein n=1 Tax=Micromonospora fluostatini TaxID=1629071 RepID=A0ABY2DHY9_9ACTN|nr:hypothetical protein E1091_08055 [Micromonospora fluostatini]
MALICFQRGESSRTGRSLHPLSGPATAPYLPDNDPKNHWFGRPRPLPMRGTRKWHHPWRVLLSGFRCPTSSGIERSTSRCWRYTSGNHRTGPPSAWYARRALPRL